MSGSFTAAHISDQKRLVRGEHWLKARTWLRIRDGVHHGSWKVLILAGGAPEGEVQTVRELMPRAHITAIDRDQKCLEAAIAAGVDDVVQCDLLADIQVIKGTYYTERKPPIQFEGRKFDVVMLDLCGGVNEQTRKVWAITRRMVTPRGVRGLTFSYGRDVVELFRYEWVQFQSDIRTSDTASAMKAAGIPEMLAGRLCYVLTASELRDCGPITTYRGNEMPMCSVLTGGPSKYCEMKYLQIGPGDFELAVTYPESSRLYDCPKDRIEGLRRKFAAIKAAYTKKNADALF